MTYRKGFNKTDNNSLLLSDDGIGVWQKFKEIPSGYMGYKFLESPGVFAFNQTYRAAG
jgi:hypothetical protein